MERVKKFIEEKEYVDWQDEHYRTSLHIASAMKDRLEIAEFLIQNDACLNFGHYVPLPIMIAADCFNSKMIDLLAKYRTEINIYTEENLHILEHMIEKYGSDPDTKSQYLETVEALCIAGADPCASSNATYNRANTSAILTALDKLDLPLFTIFTSHTKNIRKIRGNQGETLLHLICNCVYNNEEEEITLYQMACILVTNSLVDIMARDEQGNTSLHLAAGSGMTNMIKLLIMYGADLEQCNNDGFPPLFMALIFRQLRSAMFLVKKGAKSNFIVTSKGQTFLHYLYDIQTKKNPLYVPRVNDMSEIEPLADFCIYEIGIKDSALDKAAKTARDYAVSNNLVKYYPSARPVKRLYM